MFRSRSLFTVAVAFVVLALVSAACAPTAPTALPPNTATSAAPADTALPADTATSAAPADTATSAAPLDTATPEVTPLIPVTGATDTPTGGSQAPEVMVSQNATLGGLLTDGKGMTLYAFTTDTPGVSNCNGQCATAWPPFTVAAGATPTLAMGSTATAALGTFQRADGATQVTVNNMPVYYFAKDMKPGDANGQGIGTAWYVLDSTGNLVKTSAMATAMPAVATTMP